MARNNKLPKPTNARAAVMSAIQSMDEYDLTQQVVIPVIRGWGYDRVDYHGGPGEEGKDVIAWGSDELGDAELAVAQVKKYRLSARAADTRSFAGLVSQLITAFENPVPGQDGQRHTPSKVYFITPYPISTRALQTRFTKYSELRRKGLKIIDGEKLTTILIEKHPDLASALCGSEFQMSTAIASQLTNEVLMNALQVRRRPALERIYTHIDFCIARPSTRVLLHSALSPTKKTVRVREAEWDSFCSEVRLLERSCGVRILCSTPEEVSAKFHIEAEECSQRHAQLLEISAQKRDLDESITKESRALASSAVALEHRMPRLQQNIRRVVLNLEDWHKSLQADRDIAMGYEIASFLTTIKDTVERARDSEETSYRRFVASTETILHDSNRWIKLIRCGKQQQTPDIPAYCPLLDGRELAGVLEKGLDAIKSAVARLNDQEQTACTTLRQFLRNCHSFFGLAETALGNHHVRTVLGLSPGCSPDNDGSHDAVQQSENEYRLTLPVHRVFDTQENIIVLGEAGAGKTTNLQIYAHEILQRPEPKRLTIYAPLCRIFPKLWLHSDEEDPPPDLLESRLAEYLRTIGVSFTLREVVQMLTSRAMCLILDGIDEMVGRFPGIAQLIGAFAKRYPRVQVITSCRSAGAYVDAIPFVGATLLPFSDSQREQFVHNWCSGADGDVAARVLDHLAREPNIAEIVRNPLLATMLCVLAEKGLDLPRTEIALYEQRLSLLLGQYDVYKDSERLDTPQQILETLARKLAFQLHRRVRRQEDKHWLESASVHILESSIGKEGAKRALDELIHPCNILLPTPDQNEFSFGHLRFQEFLAAKELSQNRSINPTAFLNQEWWQGALVLFSQMTDNIAWLIAGGLEQHELDDRLLSTLQRLLETRAPDEQRTLRSMIYVRSTYSARLED